MQEIKDLIKNMNRISFYYIKYGSLVVFTVLVLAIACQVFMGRIGNYDYLEYLRGELLYLFKEMLGAVYGSAMILEILNLAKNCG